MEELDLKELLSIFLEKKLLIVLVIVIFAMVGVIYTLKFIEPKYESVTSLVLVQSGTNTMETSGSISSNDLTMNSKLVDNYKEIAKSKDVANRVIENLKLDIDTEKLRESVVVTAVADTELINISVTNEDPQAACNIATEFAKVFATKVEELYKLSNVHILDEAEVASQPCNINLVKNVLIFSFVGAILVFGYILLINMLDTTVKSDIDIEKALGVPVLGSIALTDESSKKKSKYSKNLNMMELELKKESNSNDVKRRTIRNRKEGM